MNLNKLFSQTLLWKCFWFMFHRREYPETFLRGGNLYAKMFLGYSPTATNKYSGITIWACPKLFSRELFMRYASRPWISRNLPWSFFMKKSFNICVSSFVFPLYFLWMFVVFASCALSISFVFPLYCQCIAVAFPLYFLCIFFVFRTRNVSPELYFAYSPSQAE